MYPLDPFIIGMGLVISNVLTHLLTAIYYRHLLAESEKETWRAARKFYQLKENE